MPVFRIEVTVRATAYIKANSEAEAQAKAVSLDGETFELTNRDMQLTDELWVSGRRYDDPALPVVSLSPAMTLRVRADSDAENVDD